ncbi:thioredoxin family protein [Aliifodinibius salipaludis]|uniref:Thioredoxin family protein n=1 Tax=Fodinibius salipaludis TaxID=2032627 RepID=A0A2A2GF72_9BACT|nr:redoxin domain-containing protein [Aliifodinibius salipaludis]PAU95515.1 thioredoxin family protein [Aliifodinibius salipaludis]
MKIRKLVYVLLILIATGLLAFLPVEDKPADRLDIGDKAPLADVEVTDVSGEKLTLAEVADENGLLVNFSCNTCPWVKAWEDRYNPIANLAEKNDIGVIMLNPNAAIRDDGESMQDMQARAKSSNYDFYYALDEKAKLAEAFGATRTPDIFLFNNDMELVYTGAIDDNAKSAQDVDQQFLKNAIQNLVAGKEINPQTTKALGCTIKWPK